MVRVGQGGHKDIRGWTGTSRGQEPNHNFTKPYHYVVARREGETESHSICTCFSTTRSIVPRQELAMYIARDTVDVSKGEAKGRYIRKVVLLCIERCPEGRDPFIMVS